MPRGRRRGARRGGGVPHADAEPAGDGRCVQGFRCVSRASPGSSDSSRCAASRRTGAASPLRLRCNAMRPRSRWAMAISSASNGADAALSRSVSAA